MLSYIGIEHIALSAAKSAEGTTTLRPPSVQYSSYGTFEARFSFGLIWFIIVTVIVSEYTFTVLSVLVTSLSSQYVTIYVRRRYKTISRKYTMAQSRFTIRFTR